MSEPRTPRRRTHVARHLRRLRAEGELDGSHRAALRPYPSGDKTPGVCPFVILIGGWAGTLPPTNIGGLSKGQDF